MMKVKSKSIGSFDAKTHLARILEEVQRGAEYIITKRGRPVARLVQFKAGDDMIKLKDIIREFGRVRNSVKGGVRIRDYINEGRRN